MTRQRKIARVPRREALPPDVQEVAPAPVSQTAAAAPTAPKPDAVSDQLDDWLRRMIEAAYT